MPRAASRGPGCARTARAACSTRRTATTSASGTTRASTACQNGILWAVNPDREVAVAEARHPAAEVHRSRGAGSELRAPRSGAAAAGAADGPQEAAKHFQIPPGFELTLFASEPMISGNPMRWPGTSAAASGSPRRRTTRTTCSRPVRAMTCIRILEDTNRDGNADKFTVFADKLSIVEQPRVRQRRRSSSRRAASSSSSRTRTATTRPTCARRS